MIKDLDSFSTVMYVPASLILKGSFAKDFSDTFDGESRMKKKAFSRNIKHYCKIQDIMMLVEFGLPLKFDNLEVIGELYFSLFVLYNNLYDGGMATSKNMKLLKNLLLDIKGNFTPRLKKYYLDEVLYSDPNKQKINGLTTEHIELDKIRKDYEQLKI